MLRRILILAAAAVVSLALCLFLALVLEWPKIVVYLIGLTPMFVAAASVGNTAQGRDRGRQ